MNYRDYNNAHSIGWNIHHIEWCTKYRYMIFRKERLKQLILQILKDIAKQYRINIVDIDIEPDHIQVIVSLPSIMSVGKAIRLLKGISPKRMFEPEPKLRL